LEAGAATTALAYPAAQPVATLILAHGAGAGQHHPFMVGFARALAAQGIEVVTFNFPYTEHKRRLPDRPPVLEACYLRAIGAVAGRHHGSSSTPLFIGGKSMGGRIATQLAAVHGELPIAGLVLLGYPLHPPGRPDQRRDRHLAEIKRPLLFVQGSRDGFGTPLELAPVLRALRPAPAVHVVEGGDHSFKLSKANASRQAAAYREAERAIVEWIRGVSGRSEGALR
jgi:predicted alpha/beta-hydrolase family hydrolase